MAESCTLIRQTIARDLPRLLRRYYEDPDVRDRMFEFLGGTHARTATAVYIALTDGYSEYHLQAPPAELTAYLNTALEVDRSLWDQQSLIADVDLEYHNFDNPAAPWIEPERAFCLQQPVLEATLDFLGEFGIHPLILVSGRGFHLLWGTARNSASFRWLSALGRVPASLQQRYRAPSGPHRSILDLSLGRAFAGLGMLMEFIAQQVLQATAHACALPVQPAAIEVGPGPGGREIISFDISEYGDPLHTRHVRLPFSAYLKPRQLEWYLGETALNRLLPMFEIPLDDLTISDAITAMRDVSRVRRLAKRTCVRIPNATESMAALFKAYNDSELAAFHKEFYSEAALPIQLPDALPPCAQFILDNPNDWLLRPAALQHLVRVLTALGWTASSIARRVAMTYLSDQGWGDTWVRLDPCNRAVFYTRLFAGLIATGVDTLTDFNCVSHQEKGYCTTFPCSSNLALYRDMLLQRHAQ